MKQSQTQAIASSLHSTRNDHKTAPQVALISRLKLKLNKNNKRLPEFNKRLPEFDERLPEFDERLPEFDEHTFDIWASALT